MLASSDFLREKVCVTVYLDELFEELQDETQENSTNNLQNESQVTESEKPSENEINMIIYGNQTANAFDRKDRSKTGHRKTKGQSKFGKLKSHLRAESKYCKGVQNKKYKPWKFDGGLKPLLKNSPIPELLLNKNKSTMTVESFLSAFKTCSEMIDREVTCPSRILTFTKSTQFDSTVFKIKKNEVLFHSKQLQTDEKDLGGVKLHTLTDVKKTEKSEDSRMDKTKRYDLKSMLEHYVKMEEGLNKKISKEKTNQDSAFAVSSSEKITNFSADKVMRIWSSCVRFWNEDPESEVSEVESHAGGNKAPKHLLLISECDVSATVEGEKGKNQFLSSVGSDKIFPVPFQKSEQCKRETQSVILEFSESEKTCTYEPTKLLVLAGPRNQFECRSKNFGEGDTFGEPSSCNILQCDSKENLLVCNKIQSQDANEINLGRTGIDRLHSKISEVKPHDLAEVFVMKTYRSSDTESEMTFAENTNGSEDSKGESDVESDKANSTAKLMETSEKAFTRKGTIVGTEWVLVCDDVGNENTCKQDWNGNGRSVSKMDLCLKDSTESTMYVIEIPTHVINHKRQSS